MICSIQGSEVNISNSPYGSSTNNGSWALWQLRAAVVCLLLLYINGFYLFICVPYVWDNGSFFSLFFYIRNAFYLIFFSITSCCKYICRLQLWCECFSYFIILGLNCYDLLNKLSLMIWCPSHPCLSLSHI